MNDQAYNDYLNNVRANATNAVQQPQQVAPQAPVQQPQQGSGGNWLTHLLPTAGSLGGGVGGAALGTSLLPGIGTIAGGILGAAFGGGGAKAAENAAEGKGIANGVGTAAVEGGVGQALGGVAGKVLGKGAELLAGRAGKITKAATDAADVAKVDKAALDTVNSTKNNYAGVGHKMQSGDQLALGTNQKMIEGLGYDSTDPYQMRLASEAGYHPTDLSLNGVYDEALQGAKPVDMSDFSNSVYKTMQNTGTTDLSTSPLGKALTDFNTKTAGKYGTDTGVELPTDMSASDVRKLQQAVGREAGHQQTIINNADHVGIPNAQAEAAHNTLSNLYDQLGAKVKTPEVDTAIAGRITTPEERATLVAKFGDTHGNQIADTIDNAKSANDLLGPMKSYTQMGKASDMAIDNIENVTASPEAVARTKMDLNGDGTADVPTQPSMAEVVPKVVNGGGGYIGAAGRAVIHGANNPAILNTLSRMGKLVSKGAPAAGVVAATAPNLGADPLAAPQQGGTMGTTMQPAQQSPLDQLYQTLLQNYQNGGGVTDDSAALASTLQNLVPQVQKNNLVSGELSALPGAFANAGGAQGAGGIMSRIAGLIPGTAAHTYQQQQAGAAQALAAQLGISPEAAAGLLPQLMQNQQTAGQNTGVLSQLTGQLAY